MNIISIKTQLETIPLKTPFITALRRVDNVEFVRVYVEFSNSIVSIGEAPATKAITGEGIEEIISSIELVKAALLDMPALKALEILHKSTIGSSAKATLDMAIVSALAQEKSLPLFKYFANVTPSVLQTDITVSFKDERSMLEDSLSYFEKGMKILKVKLGNDIDHAIRVVENILSRLADAKLIIDANQAWSVEETLRFIKAMKNVSIELIEQPVVAKDIEGLKKITQMSHIPILADEAVFTLDDAKRIVQTQSADMINIKLMKCGGLTKAVEILQYAREMNVKCMLGSMLEGPYSINVALHLAMAYTDVIRYIDLDSPLLYKEACSELEFVFEGSKITYK